ncbi:GntR family transcriptional regulator [Rhodococcus koreensis]|uniref:GntR family transcriptional regulator n=1 Tax=Rhodococcus koreensis TaxID=99653 RepID=UPI00366D07C1
MSYHADTEPVQLTMQVAAKIRGLIVDQALLPGRKIHQVGLSEQLGVSRSPLREALRVLEAEGLVSHRANRGYVVVRLSKDDLAQVYQMRGLFEAELLRTIVRPDSRVLAMVEHANARMNEAIGRRDIDDYLRWNREFHFAIFNLSTLRQFKLGVQRLWRVSEVHSSSLLSNLSEAKEGIRVDHRSIIEALIAFDVDRLMVLNDSHRLAGLE